jgi:hypothetical protein
VVEMKFRVISCEKEAIGVKRQMSKELKRLDSLPGSRGRGLLDCALSHCGGCLLERGAQMRRAEVSAESFVQTYALAAEFVRVNSMRTGSQDMRH